MIVYEFNGKKECNNLIELQEVLKHRSKGISISHNIDKRRTSMCALF